MESTHGLSMLCSWHQGLTLRMSPSETPLVTRKSTTGFMSYGSKGPREAAYHTLEISAACVPFLHAELHPVHQHVVGH
jgi:hypothetical protein